MKRLFMLLPLVLGTLLLIAQQPVLLRNSQYLGFEGHKVDLANGSLMVFWNDTSSGDSDILAQKINSQGTVLWTSARSLVAKSLEQRIQTTITASDGNVLLLYHEYDYSASNVSYWVQKVSQAGQPLWPNGGIQVINGDGYYGSVQMVANSVGGAYVVWRDSYPGNNVFGANLDALGTNLWPATPIFSHNNLGNVQAVDDGSGGLILNNRIYISGSGYVNHLLRLDAAGDIVGSNPMMGPNAVVPASFSLVKDSQNNYVLYSNQNGSLQLQKMDIGGNLLLPAIVSFPLQTYGWIEKSNIRACPNGALAYAYSYDTGDNEYHISLNYLNNALQPVWASPVDILAPGCNSLSLEPGDGLWLSWINYEYGASYQPNDQVLINRITYSGTMAFPTLAISNDTGDKQIPVIRTFENRAVFCWNDFSGSTNGLRTQAVSFDGSILQQPEGQHVYSVLNGSTELIDSFNLGNNFLHLYNDTRYSWINKIYYQITNNNGAPLLEINGRALNPGSTEHEQLLDCLVSPTNSVWVLYAIYLDNSYSLYLKEITSDGSSNPTGLGIAVSSGSFILQGCELSWVAGDIVVVWPALDPGTPYQSIYGQRFHNGIPQWQTNGKLLVSSGNYYLIPLEFKSDYLLFQKEDYNTGYVTLIVLRLNGEGNPVSGWPAEGMQVFSGNYNYTMYQQSGLVNDNLVLSTVLFSVDAIMQTKAQMISPSGAKLWNPDGIVLANSEDYNPVWITDAVYDNGVTCLLQNNDTNQTRLQRINLAGELPWGEEGTMINSLPSWNQNCSLLKFGSGVYSVFYNRNIDNFEAHLYRMDVAENGALIYSEPLTIATNYNGFWGVKAVANQYSGLVSWYDSKYYELSKKGDGISLNSLWTCSVSAPVSSDDYLATPLISKLGNHPNPFVGNTTIDFTLKEAAPVKVEIYNLKGQLVRSLMDESKSSGEYSLPWDCRDENNRAVAAGIYLYKIQAGKYSSSKKMVLLK